MARMSIDDRFLRDPRVTRLAKACGWSVREARGRLLDVFAVCYDRVDSVLLDTDIDTAAEHDGLTEQLVASDLAEPVRGGRKFRIKGAEEGIRYLARKQDAGRVGGLKSGESRREKRSSASFASKHNFAKNEAAANPLALAPDLVPDLVGVPDQPENTAGRSAPAQLSIIPEQGEIERGKNKNSSPERTESRRRPETTLPEGWVRPELPEAPAGVNAAWEEAQFRDYHQAHGSRFRDWDAAWRTWIRRATPRRAFSGSTSDQQAPAPRRLRPL